MGHANISMLGDFEMRSEAILLYMERGKGVPVARLLCAEQKIQYELCDESQDIPFDRKTLESTIRFLIDLPLQRYRLRHKTMPQIFDEIKPGSEEHFALIERDYGRFKVVPAEGQA